MNAKIKADGREGVFVLDSKKDMPYHSMGEEERERIWDDGLHFTPEGYERVGRLVGILEGRRKEGCCC